MISDDEIESGEIALVSPPGRQRGWPPTFEPAEYLADLDEWEASEAEKIEFLRTIWKVLCTFIELGFGVDSVQSILPAFHEISSGTAGEDVECKSDFQANFVDGAAPHSAAKEDAS